MSTTTTEPMARRLRTALGQFATGVVVVTTAHGGEPVGMTVNSFSSVSLEPPLVLFCVKRSSSLHPLFTASEFFAVNVLAQHQEKLSAQFSAPGRDRFGDAAWRPGRTGAPILAGSLATLDCRTTEVVAAGDHDIVLGQVVDLATDPDGPPLLYFRSSYRALA